MSDEERERELRVQRMVADKVTDEMLTKKLGDLNDAEAAVLSAALRGAYGEEILARMDALRSAR